MEKATVTVVVTLIFVDATAFFIVAAATVVVVVAAVAVAFAFAATFFIKLVLSLSHPKLQCLTSTKHATQLKFSLFFST